MGDQDAGAPLLMRVFTHPACSGCSRAVEEAWETTRSHPEIELRTVRLENRTGLDEARAEGVRTIPTIILSSAKKELHRWVGAPEKGALEAELASMTARS